MKKEIEKTVNEVKNAYTYYLEEKLNKIYGMSMNDEVSLDDMKRNIRNYVWDAAYSYKENGKTVFTKKKWFLDTVSNISSKKELYFLCRNSVNKARQTIATK